MKLYLYPSHTMMYVVESYSPVLLRTLDEYDISLDVSDWNGSLSELPDEDQVLIMFSRGVPWSLDRLISHCKERGYFLFYDDKIPGPDGRFTRKGLKEALEIFIDADGWHTQHAIEAV